MEKNQIFDLIIFQDGQHSIHQRVNLKIALKIISDSFPTPTTPQPKYLDGIHTVKVTFEST